MTDKLIPASAVLITAFLLACSSDATKDGTSASATTSARPATASAKTSASAPVAAASTAAPSAATPPPVASGPFKAPDFSTFKACELDPKDAKEAAVITTLTAAIKGAVHAYEREQFDEKTETGFHDVCASATSVPTDVPPSPYMPVAGRDFDSGDAGTGWKCLKIALTNTIEHRYGYHAKSGFIGPAAGLPDPGPTGFEVSAEGNLDGDDTSSVYTMVGFVNPETKAAQIGTAVYCTNPRE